MEMALEEWVGEVREAVWRSLGLHIYLRIPQESAVVLPAHLGSVTGIASLAVSISILTCNGRWWFHLASQGGHPGNLFSLCCLRELRGSMTVEIAPERTQRKMFNGTKWIIITTMTHPPTSPLPTPLRRQTLATGFSRRLFWCLFTYRLQNETNYDFATSQAWKLFAGFLW